MEAYGKKVVKGVDESDICYLGLKEIAKLKLTRLLISTLDNRREE